MSAPHLDEMRKWLEDPGYMDADTVQSGFGDMYTMAQELEIDLETLWLSFVNGIHKGYWHIKLGIHP